MDLHRGTLPAMFGYPRSRDAVSASCFPDLPQGLQTRHGIASRKSAIRFSCFRASFCEVCQKTSFLFVHKKRDIVRRSRIHDNRSFSLLRTFVALCGGVAANSFHHFPISGCFLGRDVYSPIIEIPVKILKSISSIGTISILPKRALS